MPDWVGGGDLGIAPEDMARHIAYDVGAAGLTRALAERLDAPAILSDFSRLVIDPNRGEDDPTLLMRIYDGTVIPANRDAGPDARARRLDRLYRPYHDAYAALAAHKASGSFIIAGLGAAGVGDHDRVDAQQHQVVAGSHLQQRGVGVVGGDQVQQVGGQRCCLGRALQSAGNRYYTEWTCHVGFQMDEGARRREARPLRKIHTNNGSRC